jgi:hypothetical protein
VDPAGWLAHRKAGWRALRSRKKLAQRELARRGPSALATPGGPAGGPAGDGGPRRGLGVGDLVANAAKQIAHGVWQVL